MTVPCHKIVHEFEDFVLVVPISMRREGNQMWDTRNTIRLRYYNYKNLFNLWNEMQCTIALISFSLQHDLYGLNSEKTVSLMNDDDNDNDN